MVGVSPPIIDDFPEIPMAVDELATVFEAASYGRSEKGCCGPNIKNVVRTVLTNLSELQCANTLSVRNAFLGTMAFLEFLCFDPGITRSTLDDRQVTQATIQQLIFSLQKLKGRLKTSEFCLLVGGQMFSVQHSQNAKQGIMHFSPSKIRHRAATNVTQVNHKAVRHWGAHCAGWLIRRYSLFSVTFGHKAILETCLRQYDRNVDAFRSYYSSSTWAAYLILSRAPTCREGSHKEYSLIHGLRLCCRVLKGRHLCLWWESIANTFTHVGHFHFHWEPGPLTSHWQLDSSGSSYKGGNDYFFLVGSVPAIVHYQLSDFTDSQMLWCCTLWFVSVGTLVHSLWWTTKNELSADTRYGRCFDPDCPQTLKDIGLLHELGKSISWSDCIPTGYINFCMSSHCGALLMVSIINTVTRTSTTDIWDSICKGGHDILLADSGCLQFVLGIVSGRKIQWFCFKWLQSVSVFSYNCYAVTSRLIPQKALIIFTDPVSLLFRRGIGGANKLDHETHWRMHIKALLRRVCYICIMCSVQDRNAIMSTASSVDIQATTTVVDWAVLLRVLPTILARTISSALCTIQIPNQRFICCHSTNYVAVSTKMGSSETTLPIFLHYFARRFLHNSFFLSQFGPAGNCTHTLLRLLNHVSFDPGINFCFLCRLRAGWWYTAVRCEAKKVFATRMPLTTHTEQYKFMLQFSVKYIYSTQEVSPKAGNLIGDLFSYTIVERLCVEDPFLNCGVLNVLTYFNNLLYEELKEKYMTAGSNVMGVIRERSVAVIVYDPDKKANKSCSTMAWFVSLNTGALQGLEESNTFILRCTLSITWSTAGVDPGIKFSPIRYASLTSLLVAMLHGFISISCIQSISFAQFTVLYFLRYSVVLYYWTWVGSYCGICLGWYTDLYNLHKSRFHVKITDLCSMLIANIGAQLVRQDASNELAGDGTTTFLVLALSLIANNNVVTAKAEFSLNAVKPFPLVRCSTVLPEKLYGGYRLEILTGATYQTKCSDVATTTCTFFCQHILRTATAKDASQLRVIIHNLLTGLLIWLDLFEYLVSANTFEKTTRVSAQIEFYRRNIWLERLSADYVTQHELYYVEVFSVVFCYFDLLMRHSSLSPLNVRTTEEDDFGCAASPFDHLTATSVLFKITEFGLPSHSHESVARCSIFIWTIACWDPGISHIYKGNICRCPLIPISDRVRTVVPHSLLTEGWHCLVEVYLNLSSDCSCAWAQFLLRSRTYVVGICGNVIKFSAASCFYWSFVLINLWIFTYFYGVAPKYYGPYKVPSSSLLHLVFHVSQLRQAIGVNTPSQTDLPPISPLGPATATPTVILGNHRMLRSTKSGMSATCLLVQWAAEVPPTCNLCDQRSFLKAYPQCARLVDAPTEQQQQVLRTFSHRAVSSSARLLTDSPSADQLHRVQPMPMNMPSCVSFAAGLTSVSNKFSGNKLEDKPCLQEGSIVRKTPPV